MSDGSLNYYPDDAVQAIFGNEEAKARNDNATTIADIVTIRASSDRWPPRGEELFADSDGYNQCAMWTAALVVRYCMARPGLITQPEDDIWQAMKAEPVYYQCLSDLGLSGFQWGWAVNTAKRIMETPPGPNPAILTYRAPEDD